MDELAQELFTAQNGYLFEFGKGVASKCNDLQGLWNVSLSGSNSLVLRRAMVVS